MGDFGEFHIWTSPPPGALREIRARRDRTESKARGRFSENNSENTQRKCEEKYSYYYPEYKHTMVRLTELALNLYRQLIHEIYLGNKFLEVIIR